MRGAAQVNDEGRPYRDPSDPAGDTWRLNWVVMVIHTLLWVRVAPAAVVWLVVNAIYFGRRAASFEPIEPSPAQSEDQPGRAGAAGGPKH